MNTPFSFVPLKNTTAFYLQAIISFAASAIGLALGIAYLPAPIWIRAFLALGMLYLITSSFTLAKCVRDQQEYRALETRVERPPGAQVPAMPPGAPYVDASGGGWS